MFGERGILREGKGLKICYGVRHVLREIPADPTSNAPHAHRDDGKEKPIFQGV